jgi:hypothetical protein
MTNEYPSSEAAEMVVRRRVGTAPQERGSCTSSGNCPDVLELTNGDFAVIGADVSGSLDLPAYAGRSETEGIVVVPRAVMLAAVRDLSGGV